MVAVAEGRQQTHPASVDYGLTIEGYVQSLEADLAGLGVDGRRRWVALRLLEDDPEIVAQLQSLPKGDSTLLPPLEIIAARRTLKDVRGREVYEYGAGVRHRCRRMVYAPSRKSALYCGSWHKRFAVNDVWEYHLGANTWRILSESDGGNHLHPTYARAAARYGRSPEKNTAKFRDWYRNNVTFRDGTLMTRGNGGNRTRRAPSRP